MANNSMVYKLFGQDVSLSKAFGAAGKAGKNMAKDVKGSLSGVSGSLAALGGGAVVGGVLAFAKKSSDAYGDLGSSVLKLQRVAGGSTTDVSHLATTMQQMGMDTDSTNALIGKFSKGLGTNEKAIQGLGVQTRDSKGHMLGFADMLPGLSDVFAKMPAGTERTALAMKLFGRNGTKMLPLLTKGSKGLKEMADEADKAGAVIGDKDTAAVKKNIIAKRKFNLAIQGVQVSLGRNLFPVLTAFTTFLGEKVVPIIGTVVTFMQQHAGVIKIVAAVVIPLVAGLFSFVKVMQIVAVVTKAWAAAQLILNSAFLTSPITWIVIGIVALVAAIVIAYKKSATFRTIVQGALHAVGAAFHWLLAAGKTVFGWVKTNWKLLLAIITGPIGLAVYFITKHWGAIKEGAKSTVKWIGDRFGMLITWFKKLPGKLAAGVKGLWNGLIDGFKSAVNFIIDGWNMLDFGIHVHLPSWLGGAGFDVDDVIPDIPRLAKGGIVSSPTLALIGEAGPEAVVPLNGRYGATSGGDTHVHIHLTGVYGGTKHDLARTIRDVVGTSGVGGLTPAFGR